MVQPDKRLRKLKWYSLSKRLGNSSGTSCQNAQETQVAHAVRNQYKVQLVFIALRQGMQINTPEHPPQPSANTPASAECQSPASAKCKNTRFSQVKSTRLDQVKEHPPQPSDIKCCRSTTTRHLNQHPEGNGHRKAECSKYTHRIVIACPMLSSTTLAQGSGCLRTVYPQRK